MDWTAWINARRSPIALDLGTHSLKLLQCVWRRSGPEIQAAAMIPLPSDLPSDPPVRTAVLAELLQQALKQGRFSSRRVVSCLPASSLEYKIIRLPRMPPEELREAVRWEAHHRLALAATGGEEPVIQFLDAGEIRQGEEFRHEIILMALPAVHVRQHLELLQRCRLEPLAIDATPTALARILPPASTTASSASSATLILDVGWSTSKVLIVRHGRVLFFKLIDLAGRHFIETLAQRFGLSMEQAQQQYRQLAEQTPGDGTAPSSAAQPDARAAAAPPVDQALEALFQELAREVDACLRYYSVTFRSGRPQELLLCGGLAADPRLGRVLQQQLDLRPQPLKLPPPAFSLPAEWEVSLRTHPALWALAWGLTQYHRPQPSVSGVPLRRSNAFRQELPV